MWLAGYGDGRDSTTETIDSPPPSPTPVLCTLQARAKGSQMMDLQVVQHTALLKSTPRLIYTLNKALARWYLRTSSPWDWSKEIVLVTGGSSGIGALLVRNLAARDIQPPLTPLPPNARFYQLDVTSPAAVRSVAQRMREDLGGDPTVLVNNAGVGTGKPLLAETEEQVRRTFDVNIVAQFWMVREFLPAMVKADHGHVVTVASMASFLTLASNVGYSCSKAAALSLHEGLTQELRYRYNARNVCTSIIHPMFTHTPLIQRATVKGDFPADLLDPEDVADAITKHILRGKSGSVFLPGWCSLISGIQGFPTILQELIRGSKAHVLDGRSFAA
ncbi:Dehydrogenase RED2 [Colletotrichum fructicola]|nr:Dehydrogenase RED2 [Colletotrichum fructicola]